MGWMRGLSVRALAQGKPQVESEVDVDRATSSSESVPNQPHTHTAEDNGTRIRRNSAAVDAQDHTTKIFKNESRVSFIPIIDIADEGQPPLVEVVIRLLYFIRGFRRIVNKETPSDEQPESRAVRALQSVFHDLRTNVKPTAINQLIPLVGWDTYPDGHTSKSASHLSTLVASLEARLGAQLSSTLRSFFEIEEKSYLHSYTPLFNCSNRLDHSFSTRVETHGYKSLQESLKGYLRPSLIYEKEKLESSCTRTIEHLPSVWMIDLRRHQYRHDTQSIVIYKHRHEYPEAFDAAKYLSNFADYSESWQYRLYAVVVFEKPVGKEGWYSFYFSPRSDGKAWYKYDDDEVEQVLADEVFEANFGLGRHDETVRLKDWNNPKGYWRYPRMAETLIYVRKSRLDSVAGYSSGVAVTVKCDK